MTLADNDTSKTYDRFLDGDEEPRRMLQPIEGFQNFPLVSLEKSVEPIVSICPDILRRVYIAMENCKDRTREQLTVDEAASIYLYTMSWKPKKECLYVALNSVLRTENRDEITPWYLYLKLVLTALTRLPSCEVVVWRGVKRDLADQYEVGKTYVWWAFSSCTKSLQVLESEHFLGKTGERTLFNIQCENGKAIASYSHFPVEEEIMILPATQFIVCGKLNPSPNLHIIQLKEIKPPFPLIELPSIPLESNALTHINAKLEQRISMCMRECMYLGQFNIVDRDIPLIIQQAINTRKCTFLDLSHNNITADGAKLVADVLKTNQFLKTLRFWQNYILDAGASSIAQALHYNKTLTVLCLASNGLTNVSAMDIACMLNVNKSLIRLYLDHNEIGDQGMISLMSALQSNQTLQKIFLHSNVISDRSILSVRAMLQQNQTLRWLSLDNNGLSYQGCDTLLNIAINSRRCIQLNL
ncbi:unnamed protein product [Adineta ricciae]|uniref:NAD(P)(+)--arginine ADP-ribosyltransferase n=1 Tax=Adineta ricciae TaxID=249248 RepID=A0A813UNM3_ADIRI|nr:unnamed protein product [Adineta ricciae]CAF1352011.1 unnamed protein product [Adineta ricciae]